MSQLQIRSYNDPIFRDKILIDSVMLSTEDSITMVESTRNNIRKLCSSAFDNLSDFPYIYLTAGITESIDFLLTQRQVYARENEYRYIFAHRSVSPKNSKDVEYRSYPFSGTGLFDEIPDTHEIILDCSYMFASNMNHTNRMLPKNVSHVMFGLSKSHNLSDLRIGWFFSRKKYLTFHTLQYSYGYTSSIIGKAVRAALEYRPNELYEQNREDISIKFSNNKLIENDTNLFGLNENGERIPFYIL